MEHEGRSAWITVRYGGYTHSTNWTIIINPGRQGRRRSILNVCCSAWIWHILLCWPSMIDWCPVKFDEMSCTEALHEMKWRYEFTRAVKPPCNYNDDVCEDEIYDRIPRSSALLLRPCFSSFFFPVSSGGRLRALYPRMLIDEIQPNWSSAGPWSRHLFTSRTLLLLWPCSATRCMSKEPCLVVRRDVPFVAIV